MTRTRPDARSIRGTRPGVRPGAMRGRGPRAAWLAILVGVAVTPGGAAPVAAPARDLAETLLVLGPRMPAARQVVKGLVDELGDEYAIVEREITAETPLAVLAAAIAETRPRALVLLNNPTVRLYRAYQAALPKGSSPPPAVVLMTAFVEGAVAGLENTTGIAYEVPAVTSFVDLRSLLGRPLRKIGVLYRAGFEAFVAAQARLAAREGFELAGRRLDEGDRVKAVKRGLRRLLDYDRIDALWVPNDNALLDPQLIARGWLPVLRHGKVPLIVGVSSLVSRTLPFGTFAVLPDHRSLGAQAAGLINDLARHGWRTVGRNGFGPPIAVEKVFNLGLARALGPVRTDKLAEIDRVIE
jgi:hypothetical protein